MSLRAALRRALTDLYFNSWRLAPANLIWGLGLIAFLVAGPMSILGALLLVLLAVPLAGIHRMAALIARDEPAAFSDFVDGMRRHAAQALAFAAGSVVLAAVLTTNIVVGLQIGGPVGWFLSAMALWGDVALLMLAVAFWPILVDPRRDGLGLWRRLGCAGLVVIGRPVRMATLTLAVVAILAISTMLFAALLLISVAFVAIVSARIVLPALDEVEARVATAAGAR